MNPRELISQVQRRMQSLRRSNLAALCLPVVVLLLVFIVIAQFSLIPRPFYLPLFGGMALLLVQLGSGARRLARAVSPSEAASVIDRAVGGKDRFLTMATLTPGDGADSALRLSLAGIEHQAGGLAPQFSLERELPFSLERKAKWSLLLSPWIIGVLAFALFYYRDRGPAPAGALPGHKEAETVRDFARDRSGISPELREKLLSVADAVEEHGLTSDEAVDQIEDAMNLANAELEKGASGQPQLNFGDIKNSSDEGPQDKKIEAPGTGPQNRKGGASSGKAHSQDEGTGDEQKTEGNGTPNGGSSSPQSKQQPPSQGASNTSDSPQQPSGKQDQKSGQSSGAKSQQADSQNASGKSEDRGGQGQSGSKGGGDGNQGASGADSGSKESGNKQKGEGAGQSAEGDRSGDGQGPSGQQNPSGEKGTGSQQGGDSPGSQGAGDKQGAGSKTDGSLPQNMVGLGDGKQKGGQAKQSDASQGQADSSSGGSSKDGSTKSGKGSTPGSAGESGSKESGSKGGKPTEPGASGKESGGGDDKSGSSDTKDAHSMLEGLRQEADSAGNASSQQKDDSSASEQGDEQDGKDASAAGASGDSQQKAGGESGSKGNKGSSASQENSAKGQDKPGSKQDNKEGSKEGAGGAGNNGNKSEKAGQQNGSSAADAGKEQGNQPQGGSNSGSEKSAGEKSADGGKTSGPDAQPPSGAEKSKPGEGSQKGTPGEPGKRSDTPSSQDKAGTPSQGEGSGNKAGNQPTTGQNEPGQDNPSSNSTKKSNPGTGTGEYRELGPTGGKMGTSLGAPPKQTDKVEVPMEEKVVVRSLGSSDQKLYRNSPGARAVTQLGADDFKKPEPEMAHKTQPMPLEYQELFGGKR